jgi:nucleoside-diphosphate kinase
MDRTLLFIKPDGVQRRLIGRIVGRLEEKGLQIIGLKMLRLDRKTAEAHYAPHKAKAFFPSLLAYITSGPVVAIAVQGRNAVQITRKLMGATFASQAEPGTIRGDLGLSDGLNLIHGSDSPEAAREELARFFRPEELHPYEPCDFSWVYDTSAAEPR